MNKIKPDYNHFKEVQEDPYVDLMKDVKALEYYLKEVKRKLKNFDRETLI
jgi:hypothetical protein